MSWSDGIGNWLFGNLIKRRVQEAIPDADEKLWRNLSAAGLRDVPFAEHLENLHDSVLAYRTNPLAFRLIETMVSYVLGGGVLLEAEDGQVMKFLREWWSHRQNRLNVRQFELGTELGLSGELFVTFHTNPFDGMTYIRTVPASLINDVEVDGEDRERELRFHEDSGVQSVDGVTRTASASGRSTEGRWWSSEEMRHYAINRVTGAVRGQGELVAVLPWLSRYKDWLTDRVLINRYKGAFLWDVTLEGADRAAILARRAELAEAPKPGSILLHNERETWQAIQPAIGSSDVERDGHALRLMIAAGAGVPLHFLAEGQDTNVATAREMARPTLRHYGRRQLVVGEMFEDIANEALRRSGRFGEGPWGVRAVFEDLSRRDTEESARATKAGAEGLAVAVERGWITNDEARELFNRFAEFTGEANELSGKARSTRSELEPTGSNGSARADAAANPKNAGS